MILEEALWQELHELTSREEPCFEIFKRHIPYAQWFTDKKTYNPNL